MKLDWWRRLVAGRGGRNGEAEGGPWPPGTRVAFVAPWFRPRSAPAFPSFRDPGLARYRPDVIAAPLPALLEMAEAMLRGKADPAEAELGVAPLTGVGRPAIHPAERNLLWMALGVPVFEQFRGPAGELLAWECEAHAGLHVVAGRAEFFKARGETEIRVRLTRESIAAPTGLEGRIETEPCACGREGLRLCDLRTAGETPEQALTAAV